MQQEKQLQNHHFWLRLGAWMLVTLFFIGCIATLSVTESKKRIYQTQVEVPTPKSLVTPFPISVNPQTSTITYSADVLQYLNTELASEDSKPIRTSWWHNLTRKLAQMPWYQSLASPMSRVLVVWPGDRKEQVIDNIGDIMRWDTAERSRFETAVTERSSLPLVDGYYFPGQYITTIDMSPEAVADLITENFLSVVKNRYPEELENIVSLSDTLIIASLLERESASFEDMREISGVVWNRLFIDMPLQLDATLQYVKANDPDQTAWWPVPRPEDKFLDSPYNTYQNKGLPPGPIANPSAAAILAALNPNLTDCLFYFHHTDRSMHCSATYEEHIAKLKAFYGQGR